MTWLDEHDRKKLSDALLKGRRNKKAKYLRVLIGCTIEFPIDDMPHGESGIEEVIDKCREYGTGEIVDAKFVFVDQDAEC